MNIATIDGLMFHAASFYVVAGSGQLILMGVHADACPCGLFLQPVVYRGSPN